MTKKEKRQEIKAILQAIGSQQRGEASREAAKHCMKLLSEIKQKIGIVGLFSSLAEEIDTLPLLNLLLAESYRVALPRVEGQDLQFYEITQTGGDFYDISPYGIREPLPRAENCVTNALGVVLVPALAYTADGDRLGRGKGFYDRFLSKFNPAVTVGYIFHEQLLPTLPTEEHDQKVDFIVSNKDILYI